MIRIQSWKNVLGIVPICLVLGVGLGSTEVEAQVNQIVFGIEDAVRTALGANPDVVAARLGLAEAEESVSEAWSEVYPSVDLNASYSRNISPTVNFLPASIFDPTAGPDDYLAVRFGADNQWASTISVEQPLLRPSVFVGVGAASRFEQRQSDAVRG